MSERLSAFVDRVEDALRRAGLPSAELRAEVLDHLIASASQLERQGMSREAAIDEALDRFGSPEDLAAMMRANRRLATERGMVRHALSLLAAMGAVASTIVVFGAALFLFAHRQSVATSAAEAGREMGRLRARFAGQAPLVDMAARRARAENATAPARRVRAFHTVILDTRGSTRVVRLTVPRWFGRLFAGRSGELKWLGELTWLDDTEFDAEPIRLSWEQVDRHGPGLLVDYRHPSGGQFIAWAD